MGSKEIAEVKWGKQKAKSEGKEESERFFNARKFSIGLGVMIALISGFYAGGWFYRDINNLIQKKEAFSPQITRENTIDGYVINAKNLDLYGYSGLRDVQFFHNELYHEDGVFVTNPYTSNSV